MEKKPTTLKGWQKIYPDAIQIKATGSNVFSDKQIIELAYGVGAYGKVLLNKSWGTLSSKGTKFNINAIVSQTVLMLLLAFAPFMAFSQAPGKGTQNADSGSAGHIIFFGGMGTTTITHQIYRDTTPLPPPNGIYTHPAYQLINSFYYSYYKKNNGHDTEFIYDHFEWLRCRCREEQKYWNSIFDDAAKKLDVKTMGSSCYKMAYYAGMEDMLEDLLNNHGQRKWQFKSKDLQSLSKKH